MSPKLVEKMNCYDNKELLLATKVKFNNASNQTSLKHSSNNYIENRSSQLETLNVDINNDDKYFNSLMISESIGSKSISNFMEDELVKPAVLTNILQQQEPLNLPLNQLGYKLSTIHYLIQIMFLMNVVAFFRLIKFQTPLKIQFTKKMTRMIHKEYIVQQKTLLMKAQMFWKVVMPT